MDPRSSNLGSSSGNRRAPIPRPWLSEHHHVRPLHLPPDYRYAPSAAPDSMDILPKQEWHVSWDKLSCCFCDHKSSRRGAQSPSQKNNANDERRQSGTNGGGRRHHNDHVPFPAFPILRRNSSSSLLANENDVYPSSGSVSSFTESDTSHSESKVVVPVAVFRNSTYGSGDRPASPPRPWTPRAAAPVTAKPQTMANNRRSAAAGLPPTKHRNSNSSSGNTNPQQQQTATRGRFESVGDHTGVFSAATNNSRHRRDQQFEFSTSSITEIWEGKPVDEKLVLPSYVLCQDANQLRPNDSGYISALDDSEDCGATTGTNHSDSFYDGDHDDDYADEINEMNNRQLHQGMGITPAVERRRRNDQRPPKAFSSGRRSRGGHRNKSKDAKKGQRLPPEKPAYDSKMVPVYLRKNTNLDNVTTGTLVVSGWIAFSLGSALEDRLRESKRVDAKNILYLRIIDDVTAGARILLHSSNGVVVHELHLHRDWMCESREISSRIGRCVNIRSRASSMTSIANLLPVSLDDAFFQNDEELVSAQQFTTLQDRLFVPGKGAKVYAPDEQHDAAMYIMFSLDTLIKNCL